MTVHFHKRVPFRKGGESVTAVSITNGRQRVLHGEEGEGKNHRKIRYVMKGQPLMGLFYRLMAIAAVTLSLLRAILMCCT